MLELLLNEEHGPDLTDQDPQIVRLTPEAGIGSITANSGRCEWDYSRGKRFPSFASFDETQKLPECEKDHHRLELAIKDFLDKLSVFAKRLGFKKSVFDWALTELVTNATQYGRYDSAGNVNTRIGWSVQEADDNGKIMSISGVNSGANLFNVCEHADIPEDVMLERIIDSNSHTGTVRVLDAAKKIRYVWLLEDGSKIRFEVAKKGNACLGEDSPNQDYFPTSRKVEKKFPDGLIDHGYTMASFLGDCRDKREAVAVLVNPIFQI